MSYPDPYSHLHLIATPLNRLYFGHAALVRTTTADLRNAVTLEYYMNAGFMYIRRLHYNYHYIMREPTNGCYVELTKERDIGSIPIDSAAARKLIRRVSYF